MKTLLAASLVLMLSACTTSGNPGRGGTPELAGTRWAITRIDGKAPVTGPALIADFSMDGRISGDAGCNSFSGPYIQEGLKVNIGELLSTRRACVDTARQQQETRVLAILQGEGTLRMERERLNLRSADGTLVLSPSGPPVVGYQP